MDFAAYIDLPGVNWSTLRILEDGSPLHYRHAIANDAPDLRHLQIGRYIHTAILEPERLLQDYAIWDGHRRGKSYAAFVADNAERTILTRADVTILDACAASVRDHHGARTLIDSGAHESTIRWTDADTGIACKARPDVAGSDVVVDLKTTRSVNVRRFINEIGRHHYLGQMAFYRAGIEATMGRKPKSHIIAIEKMPPFDVAIYTLDDFAEFVGDSMVRRLLDQLAICRREDRWPGRHPDPVMLGENNLPPWMTGATALPEFEFVEE